MILGSGVDLGDAGFDYIYGNGRADALATYNDNTLPVELTSFTANLIGSSVVLKWETATEIDNYGFDIERCANYKNFERIGFIEGAGNSNSPKYYEFTDDYVNGVLRYRLKQIDTDGQFAYSDIIEIETPTIETYELYQNNPNPFNPTTTIKYALPKESKVLLEVYNTLGQKVVTLIDEVKSAGYFSLEFNARNLPSGIFIYRLRAGDYIETKKMVLLR
jgi:hypothetical protein